MKESENGIRQRRSSTEDTGAAKRGKPIGAAETEKGHPARKPVSLRPQTSPRSGKRVVFLCFLIGMAATVGVVRYLPQLAKLHRDYDPHHTAAKEPMSLYSAEAAMRHVEEIAKEPRWSGSKALDRSLDYVSREIENMVAVAESNGMLLEVESFTSNGSFPCSTGLTKVVISYSNVLSIVARISPIELSGQEIDTSREGNDPEQTLLVNAHVDSGLGSPGANDNVVGVAVALESLRCIASLSQAANRLSRSIVFLFNGAEEPLLAGAHGFVTSHRWAKGVAAHINLESIGAGDSYHLFQMGPRNAWLAHAYAKAVRSPSGTAGSSDIFELGLIPAETDFRIFKEFGIPGYDFALVGNGHVYHTIYDDVKHVSMDALVYGGKVLLLPLAMELAGRDDAIGRHRKQLKAPKPAFSLTGIDSRVVYFDVLHIFIFAYSHEIGFLVSCMAMLLWAIVWGRQTSATLRHTTSTAKLKLRMLLVLLGCLVSMAASGLAFAMYVVHILGRPLAWYGSYEFALAMYVPILVIGATIALQILLPSCSNANVAFDGMLFAVSTIYVIELFGVTMAGLRIGYLPLSLLMPTLLISMGIIPRRPVFVSFMTMLLPCIVLGAATFHFTGSLLLSLMGRSGTAPSEIFASLLIVVPFCQYFFLPLLPVLARFPASLRSIRKFCIYVASFMTFLVWILPELTLPHRSAVYSRDAPKRIIAMHFHSPGMSPPNVLGIVGLDAVPVDINTTVRMFPFSDLDALKDATVWGALNSTILESARAYQAFLAPPTVFKVDEALDLGVPTAMVVEEHMDETTDDRANVTILINAPDSHLMTLRVALETEGGNISAWSFDAPIEDLGDGGGCWVRHVGRGLGVEQLEFSVLVKTKSLEMRPRISVDVTNARPGKSRSEVLKKLYFPMWVSPLFIQATGASFVL
jgi:Peptidase family M28